MYIKYAGQEVEGFTNFSKKNYSPGYPKGDNAHNKIDTGAPRNIHFDLKTNAQW